jgi:hypothetical protein
VVTVYWRLNNLGAQVEAQIVFNHVGGKPPFFDGTSSFDYWQRKVKMYLGSINDRVWEVIEHDFVILDPTNPTDNDRANKQCNTMALNTIYTIALMQKCLSKLRILRRLVKCEQD